MGKEATEVIFTAKAPKLKNPILIEGLPGIGYIGRNAVGYLLDELKAVKFAEIHSHHFPFVVLLDPKKNGQITPIKNEFYYVKGKARDIVILIGDAQSITPEGHYQVVDKILDVSEKLGVKEMITLGGFATGVLSEQKPKVFGAGIDLKLMNAFEKLGVVFKNTNIGQIIGASGLLISIGYQRKINGVCLMGETSGMLLSDPKSTESVLEVITKYLGIKIDMTKLDAKIKEIEKIIEKIESLQGKIAPSGAAPSKKKEELGYIG